MGADAGWRLHTSPQITVPQHAIPRLGLHSTETFAVQTTCMRPCGFLPAALLCLQRSLADSQRITVSPKASRTNGLLAPDLESQAHCRL